MLADVVQRQTPEALDYGAARVQAKPVQTFGSKKNTDVPDQYSASFLLGF